MTESRIIVALDGMEWTRARHLARSLRGEVWGFKVNDALIDAGVSAVEQLKGLGDCGVFADPKLLDIPNTVKNGVRRLAKAGADIITVHALGGWSMLKAAYEEGGPVVAAVTVLTSMDDEECKLVYGKTRDEQVRHLAIMAQSTGVRKVICSVADLAMPEIEVFQKIVPGIRTEAVAGEDQKTVGVPVVGTYDLVVIGRPITQSLDPVKAAKEWNATLAAKTQA